MKQESFTYSITDFGAIGDGETDNTQAIQAALDKANEEDGGGVWVPPGRYATGQLKLHSGGGLFATPTWGYVTNAATQLILNNPNAKCLLDLSGTYGARVSGLELIGKKLGSTIHGIFSQKPSGHREEGSIIEDCRITLFSGDAIHYQAAFAFFVRRNMIIFNGGSGFSYSGCDGWIQDNVINNCGGWGVFGRPWNTSVTVTGNRIEWNDLGGIRLGHGSHYQICNNYIDRSGGPGIQLDAGEPEDKAHGRSGTHTITGNVIYRSGAIAEYDSPECCHLNLLYQEGVTVTGNTFNAGQGDSGGRFSPSQGIRHEALLDTVIANNSWTNGVLGKFIAPVGEVDETVIIKDNPGRISTNPRSEITGQTHAQKMFNH